jgi:hypothetical protein
VGPELSARHDPKTAIGSASATRTRAADFIGAMGRPLSGVDQRQRDHAGETERLDTLLSTPEPDRGVALGSRRIGHFGMWIVTGRYGVESAGTPLDFIHGRRGPQDVHNALGVVVFGASIA